MNQADKKQILESLQSNQTSQVLQALEELAKEGDASFLPAIFQTLNNTTDQQVDDAITSLLMQIKHQDAVPYLIEALQDDGLIDIRENLISACWENGLDYKEYLSVFVDLLISGSFMEAFDVVTVITSMSGSIAVEKCQKEVEKIQQAMSKKTEEEIGFLEEAIEHIQALAQGVEPEEC